MRKKEKDKSLIETTAKNSTEELKPKNIFMKILEITGEICFWLLCLSLVGGSILFSFSNDTRKSYFGYRFYAVLTNSMSPKEGTDDPPGGFSKGDMIIIKIVDDPAEIKPGDIITFNPNPRDTESRTFLTHRVIEVKTDVDGLEGTYFITRGDRNNSNDPPISSKMLIGKKVAVIPKAGNVLQFIRDNFVISIVIIICFFGSIILFRWYLSPLEEYDDEQKDEVKNAITSEKNSIENEAQTKASENANNADAL